MAYIFQSNNDNYDNDNIDKNDNYDDDKNNNNDNYDD